MPVVITDQTNRVWAVEQPTDGFIHVGFTGRPGPKLTHVLDFIATREKQFNQFVAKQVELEEKESAKKRRATRPRIRGGADVQSAR